MYSNKQKSKLAVLNHLFFCGWLWWTSLIFLDCVHLLTVRDDSVLWQLKHLFRFYSLHAGAMDSSSNGCSHDGRIMTTWELTCGLKILDRFLLFKCLLFNIHNWKRHASWSAAKKDYLRGWNYSWFETFWQF